MPTSSRKLIVLWILLAILLLGAAGFVFLLTIPPPLERWLQGRIQLALREHYRSEVQLQNLHATLIPSFEATGDNFVLPNRGDGAYLPLIMVKHFTVRAGFFELLRTPVHLSWVKLEGLEIHVPPKQDLNPGEGALQPKSHTHLAYFVIDQVDADGAELYVLRKDPSRDPMNFELRKLTLHSAGVGRPMKFSAELTNPTPPGLIETTGHFGPWNFDEPSATKVDGRYDFQHADLAVFNGISGTLSSTGNYSGVLENIVVDGATDTPDFKLDSGGQAVHLTTRFHAIVDGTNGNTYLQSVNAHFLNSDISTEGEVASRPGQHGKTISLDVDIHHALVQDVLALAAKSDPAALSGELILKAKLELPPGKEPVLRKMKMTGMFHVSDARFTTEKISNAITELSRRGQGKPNDTSIANVPAEFEGDFGLGTGSLSFSRLQFVVPGAVAQVKGSYGLQTEAVGFEGDVRLDARVSQTMKGAKRWLLVPFDPLFNKHGAGTYLPVAISGTRQHPEVKLQFKKLL